MAVKSSSVPTFLAIAGIRLGLAVIYECYLVDPASSHMLVSKIKPCMLQSKSLNEDPLEGKSGASSALNLGMGRRSAFASTGRLVPSVGDALLVLTDRDFDPIVLAFGIGVMINRDSRGHSYFIVRDTVLVSTISDADQGSADVGFRTPLAHYEKSKFLGSGSMVARLKLKGIVEGHHQEWSLRLNLTQHGKLTRSLLWLVFNEEFLVSASHQLALTTSLPFVHTARRSYESVNHRVFERKLRPKPSGRGHVCLGVTNRRPHPLEDMGRKLVSVCYRTRLAKIELRAPGRLDMRW
ncbi:hypothetical protein Bca4012_103624 [Brassica carinata]